MHRLIISILAGNKQENEERMDNISVQTGTGEVASVSIFPKIRVTFNVWGIIWGLSGASSGAFLGHHIAHVWGIIWGMSGASAGASSGASMDNNPLRYLHI